MHRRPGCRICGPDESWATQKTTPRELLYATGDALATRSSELRHHTSQEDTTLKLVQTLVAVALSASLGAAIAADGLVATKRPHGAKSTMDRLDQVEKQRGLTIFVRVDHSAATTQAGKTLRPTEVLIFSRLQGGTPFMECGQSVGIDLPLKALVWEDAAAQVWTGYNDPAVLALRHGAPQCPAVENLRKALESMAGVVTANRRCQWLCLIGPRALLPAPHDNRDAAADAPDAPAKRRSI